MDRMVGSYGRQKECVAGDFAQKTQEPISNEKNMSGGGKGKG